MFIRKKRFVIIYSDYCRLFLAINIYFTELKKIVSLYFLIGAKNIFPAPNYEKADCGESEDISARQAGVAKVLTLASVCGETKRMIDLQMKDQRSRGQENKTTRKEDFQKMSIRRQEH